MSIYTNPWFVVTTLGDPRLWIAVCAVLFLARAFCKRDSENKSLSWVKTFIIFSGVAMLVGVVLSEGAEYYFKVPRPCSTSENPYCPGGYSFPSTHTTTAFIVFPGLYLALKKKKHLWLFALPPLVGFSRLALGVHTLYDVIGGGLLGLSVFLLLYFWVARNQHLTRLAERLF